LLWEEEISGRAYEESRVQDLFGVKKICQNLKRKVELKRAEYCLNGARHDKLYA